MYINPAKVQTSSALGLKKKKTADPATRTLLTRMQSRFTDTATVYIWGCMYYGNDREKSHFLQGRNTSGCCYESCFSFLFCVKMKKTVLPKNPFTKSQRNTSGLTFSPTKKIPRLFSDSQTVVSNKFISHACMQYCICRMRYNIYRMHHMRYCICRINIYPTLTNLFIPHHLR